MSVGHTVFLAASFAAALTCGSTLASDPSIAQATPATQDDADQKKLDNAIAKAKAAQAEVDRIKARMGAKRGLQGQSVALAKSQEGAFAAGAKKLNELVGRPLKPPAPEQPADSCSPQKLYIRADRLDTNSYLYPQSVDAAADAVGASASYTDDRISGQRTLSVNGQISYVLFRNLCPEMAAPLVPFLSGWAIAPWVSGNGDYTSPRSTKEESSAKVGVDMQAEVSFGIPFLDNFPLRQVFAASPYYQTDFRGEANISGVTFSWTPYDARYHIGGYLGHNQYLDWYLQTSAEADVRQVRNPGLTGLADASYSWVGGTARLSLFFLPLVGGPFIQDRFSFVATGWFYHDLQSGTDIYKYSVLLKYKIVPQGYSSLAFEYSRGTDKDMLVFADKYMAKLLVAY